MNERRGLPPRFPANRGSLSTEKGSVGEGSDLRVVDMLSCPSLSESRSQSLSGLKADRTVCANDGAIDDVLVSDRVLCLIPPDWGIRGEPEFDSRCVVSVVAHPCSSSDSMYECDCDRSWSDSVLAEGTCRCVVSTASILRLRFRRAREGYGGGGSFGRGVDNMMVFSMGSVDGEESAKGDDMSVLMVERNLRVRL